MHIKSIFLLIVVLVERTLSQVQMFPVKKEVTASTIYHLKVQLTKTLPVGSVIELDFANSDIITSTADLFSCYHIPAGTSTQIKYTSCSCNSAKKCFATVSQEISSTDILNFYMGNVQNPIYMKSQTVSLLITFNSASPSTLSDSITITDTTYIASSILTPTLTQASNVVLTPNKFTIVFQPVINIPQDSKVFLRLPIEVSFSTASTLVVKGMIGSAVEQSYSYVRQQSSDQKEEVVLTNIFSAGLYSINNNLGPITIHLENIINPSSVSSSTTGILIFVKSSNNYLSQQSSSTDLICKSETAKSISLGNDMMYAIPNIKTISLEMTTLVLQFTPEVAFDSTATIQVVMPSAFTFNSNNVVNAGIFGSTVTVTLDGQNINIRGSSNVGNQMQSLFLKGVINPPNTITTGKILLKQYNSNNYLVQEYKGSLTYTADPGTLILLNSSPLSTSTILTADTDITIEIQLAHPIDQDSYIYLTVPETVLLKKDPSILNCYKVLSNVASTHTCSVLSTANSQVIIKMKEFCSSGSACPKDTIMKFQIKSTFKNPPFIKPTTDSMSIATWTPNEQGKYNELITGMVVSPSLTPNPLTDLVINYQNILGSATSAIYSEQDRYVATFSPYDYMRTNGGSIKFSFPKGALILKSSSSIPQCYLSSSSATTDCIYTLHNDNDHLEGIATISQQNLCTSNTCATGSVTLRITQFLSPLSNQPIDTSSIPYTIQTYSSAGYYLSLKTLTVLTSSGNQLQLTPITTNIIPFYTLSSNQVNHLDTEISIQIQLNYPFPPLNHVLYKSKLSVQLPVQPGNFQLDSSSTCSVNTVNTIQLTCAVSEYSTGMTQISYTGSSATSADTWSKLLNQPILVKITKLTNPASLQPTNSLTISTFSNTDNYIQQTTSLKVTLTDFAPLTAVTVGRKEPAVLSAETELTFVITLATKLYLTNSYIQLDIAREQAVFQTSESSLIAADIVASLQLKRLNTDSTLTPLSYSVKTISTDYIQIYFQESTCPCASGNVLTYKLINGNAQKVTLRNPGTSALATKSIKVHTYDDKEYGVDKKTSDILIKPFLSTGSLTLNSVSTSTRKVFTASLLTINVKVQTLLLTTEAKNQVVVQLPQYLYYPSDQTNAFSPTCSINTDSVTSCTTSLKHENDDTNLPKYISEVYILLDSTTLATLNSLAFFDIKIQGQLSYYDFFTATASQQIVVSTTSTTNNYMQDSLTISLENKNMFPNEGTAFKTVAATRDLSKLGQQVTVLFTVTLNSIIKVSRVIYIKVPKSQLKTMTPAPVCAFKVGAELKTINCLVFSQDVNYFTLEVQNSFISYCNSNTKTSFCDVDSNLQLQVTNLENNNEMPDMADIKSFLFTLKDDSKTNTIIESSITQDQLSPILVVGTFLDIILSSDNGLVAKDNTITINGKLQNQLKAQSKINVIFSNDLLLISNSYKLDCKLATLEDARIFSIQDLREVQCNYILDPLTFAIKQVTISNPCRFDSSCPINTKIYIQFQSANLLYRQTYSGTIDLIGYSANNLQVVNSQMSHSNLKSLTVYPLNNQQLVITRSVNTASAATALTIHYTSPTRLITASAITFYLPKGMITISSKPSTCAALLPQGFDCAFSFDSSDANYYKIVVSQTFCKASNALFCEANTQLKFTLSGSEITNPAQMKLEGVSYNSIDVKYTGSQQIQELSYNYNNVITPSISKGTITNISITRSVATAYKLTQLNIVFTIENAITASEYILLQLPMGMTFKDTNNAYQVKRFTDSNYNTLLRSLSSGQITVSYSTTDQVQHFLLTGICTTDCTNGKQLYLTIENTRNNYYLLTDNLPFTVSSLDASKYVKDSGQILYNSITPALVAYDISVVTVTRSVRFYTLESDFSFTIKLNSDQYLLSTSIIRVTLPFSQMKKIGEDYYLLKSDNVQRVSLTKVSSTSSAFIMEFLVFDTSTKDYSFVLKGFQNSDSNPTSDAANSIYVELLTEDYQLMSKNTYNVMVTQSMILQTQYIENVKIEQDNLVDGQNTVVTYSFQLKQSISDGTSNDYVLKLPKYRFYYQNYLTQNLLNCQVFNANVNTYIDLDDNNCKSTFDTTNKYITQIQFKKICNDKIMCSQANQQMHLKFKLKNQPSTRPYNKNSDNQYFQLQYIKDSQSIYDIKYLYTQPSASASDITDMTLSMSDNTVQKANVEMDMQFKLSNIVNKDGNISLTMPSQMMTAIPSSCSASQVINNKETSLSCRPTSDGLIAIVQSYSIVDTYDLYGKILVKAKIKGMTNPLTNLPTDPISVTSYAMYVEDSYIIDKNQKTVSYTASTLGSLTLNTITRSTATLNSDITFTAGITTVNAIPAGGFLMLDVLPSYQLVFKLNDGASLTCQNSLNSAQPIKCYVFGTFIKVTDLCGVNTLCAGGSSFNIIVSSGIRNPRFVQVTSMKFYTGMQVQNQVGYIDGKTSGIIASPPLSPTVLTLSSLTRSTHNCLSDSQLTVSFSSTNAFLYKQSSRFQIAFEQNVMLPSKDIDMKCRVNNAIDVTCNYTLYSDQQVNTIKTVDIYGFCAQNDPCLPNEQITVVIDGLINSYEQWDYKDNNVIFRTHIQDYKYDYVQADIVTAPLINYFQPSLATTSTLIDIRPSTPIKSFSNTLQLTLALNTYLVKDQYIVMTYDKALLPDNLDNIQCSVLSGSKTKKATCVKQNNNQLKVSDYLSITIAQPSRLVVSIIDFVNPVITNGDDSQVFQLISEVQVISKDNRLQEQYTDANRMAITLYTKRTNTGCTDSNCQYCLSTQKDNCIQCKSPGNFPLLTKDTNTHNSKGSCLNQCPPGSFLSAQLCLNCNSNCKTCTGPKNDDCTACDSSNSQVNVFDSGRCSNKCMKGQTPISNLNPQVFPVESAKVCAKSPGTGCSQDMCGANCMSDSKYCSKPCVKPDNAFSYLQKQCVSSDSCDDGYSLTSSFLDYKTCAPCSDQCAKCLPESPSTCSQCNPLFLKKYNYNTACIEQCPFKYFAEPNTNICKTCSTGCNSCKGPAKEDCLSCETNQFYYYGECLNDCPIGSIKNGQMCYSACQNTNCYQCSDSSDTSKCSSCRGVNSILYQGDCRSSCPQSTYQDNLTCKTCPAGCKSCSNGLGCDLCTDPTKSVYKGSCVNNCPTGYSRNYLTTVCMQFNCQSPCAQCAFYENECVTCLNNMFSYKLTCHQNNCPKGSFTNSTALKQCDTCQSPCKTCSNSKSSCDTCQKPLMLYNSLCETQCPMQFLNNDGICLYVYYPTQCWILIALFCFSAVYFSISWGKKKNRLHKLNAIICLLGPLIMLTRLFLLISYSSLKVAPFMAITFLTLFTNIVLAVIFNQYLNEFEQQLPSVKTFIYDHSKGYKCIRAVMLMSGVKVFKVFSSGLLCMPHNNFDRLPPYLFSMNRLLRYSLVLGIFQFLVSLYTISTYNSAIGNIFIFISLLDAFHLSMLDIFFNLMADICVYYKSYYDQKMKVDYSSNEFRQMSEQDELNPEEEEGEEGEEEEEGEEGEEGEERKEDNEQGDKSAFFNNSFNENNEKSVENKDEEDNNIRQEEYKI